MLRQGFQDVARRAGRVEEKANPVAMSARPQFARQQHQVIIVHPDDVVLMDQRAQSSAEHPVDPHVAARVGARVFLQVDPVVKDGPEHAVGETVVIFLNVVRPQIEQDVGDLVDFDRPCFAGRLVRNLAAPAEPKPVSILQGCLDRHRHSSGLRRPGQVRNRHPVGNDDESLTHAFAPYPRPPVGAAAATGEFIFRWRTYNLSVSALGALRASAPGAVPAGSSRRSGGSL